MTRPRVVVVCPGRGTYNQTEWGYYHRYHPDKAALLDSFDRYRREQRQIALRDLDRSMPFSPALHTRGDHASALIYACAYADALSIPADRYEVVAVTGNSMGWYIALAVAGALEPLEALRLINTMGVLMHESLIGGQVLYPCTGDDWRPAPEMRARLLQIAREAGSGAGGQVYLSIDLGGLLVFGGNEAGLERLSQALPKKDRYPMRLHNHAAFHTPLQRPVRDKAREVLAGLPVAAPRVPLVDGRGQVWTPYSADPRALWDYTLGHQLTEPYDFTRAVTVAVREFAPDKIVILGPGTTLGGAVAQILIALDWRGLKDKADFQARQEKDPPVLAMGWEAQRARVVSR